MIRKLFVALLIAMSAPACAGIPIDRAADIADTSAVGAMDTAAALVALGGRGEWWAPPTVATLRASGPAIGAAVRAAVTGAMGGPVDAGALAKDLTKRVTDALRESLLAFLGVDAPPRAERERIAAGVVDLVGGIVNAQLDAWLGGAEGLSSVAP